MPHKKPSPTNADRARLVEMVDELDATAGALLAALQEFYPRQSFERRTAQTFRNRVTRFKQDIGDRFTGEQFSDRLDPWGTP